MVLSVGVQFYKAQPMLGNVSIELDCVIALGVTGCQIIVPGDSPGWSNG